MESPFGKRLFRLFLLFSMVPAVLIAALGYYLASQQSVTSSADEPLRLTDFAGYYNDYLFERINMTVLAYTDGADSEGFLDFVIPLSDSLAQHEDYLATEVHKGIFPKKEIATAAFDRSQGFVEWRGRYYQYVRIELPDGSDLVGGLIHDESYTALLDSIQANYASVSSRHTLATNYLYFLAAIFAILAATTIGLAYYFAARISRNLASPLTELSRASNRIAGGDFDQRVEVGGVGEVALLIDNFNQMARQLKIITTQLAQTERVAAWRTVARRFAHDLKNPLQPIMVSLYRIEKGLKESGQYNQMIEPIQAASEELKHLTELADRFSQLAKLPEPNVKRTDVTELLSSMSSLYKEQLVGYDFQYEPWSEPVTADLDATYFREVLHNLILNAVDASNSGGKITLRLRHETNHLIVQVQDFGCGMSEETISSARIPYFTTKEKGTGLGLAVVEKIISELEGNLNIDSSEGKGTTVTITLPLESDIYGKNSDR